MTIKDREPTEAMVERLAAYAREASVALMAISGGGSEMFKRIGEEYYAEPDLCLARYREKMEMRERLRSASPPVDHGRVEKRLESYELAGKVGAAIADAVEDQGFELSPPQALYVTLKALEPIKAALTNKDTT